MTPPDSIGEGCVRIAIVSGILALLLLVALWCTPMADRACVDRGGQVITGTHGCLEPTGR